MSEVKPKKLLVISMLYEPDCVGIAAIASDMCAGLAERGHDVTVYTSYPYYPEWRLKREVNPWRIQHESLANVKIKRHGLFIPANPSRLFPRLLHELSFPLSLTRSLFDRQRFEAVIVFCPLLGSVAFAALRKALFREPLWLNIQDIPSDASLASGINRSKLFHYLGSFVQRYLLNCGDTWSSISPEMIARLETIKADKTKIHLCPNWLTGSLYRHVRELPCKVGSRPHNPLRLLYCGTIGKKQGLLEFCQRISNSDIKFQLQINGDGGEAENVRRWIAASGDRRFEFSELLPETEFVKSLHAADWFVIPEKAGSGSSFLPSKLIPSICAGTPVLAVADRRGPLGSEVTDHKVGMVVEWSELDGLASRLNQFEENPALFETLQNNCLRRAKDHGREQAIGRLETLMLAPQPNGKPKS